MNNQNPIEAAWRKAIHRNVLELEPLLNEVEGATTALLSMTGELLRMKDDEVLVEPGSESMVWIAGQVDHNVQALSKAYKTLSRMTYCADGHADAEGPVKRVAPAPAPSAPSPAPAAPAPSAEPDESAEIVKLVNDWHASRLEARTAKGPDLRLLQEHISNIEGQLLRRPPIRREGVMAFLEMAQTIATDRELDDWTGDGPTVALIMHAHDGVGYLEDPKERF